MVKSQPTAVYTFKVALKYSPDIWRLIEVPGNQTLEDLHFAIFEAFDRYDEHLYSFYFEPPGGYRGRRRPSRNAVEFTHPYAAEEADPWDGLAPHDASQTTIDSLNLHRGRKFEYLFDFGDSWWHEITVVKTDGHRRRGHYPRIVEKHGKSPPQYPDYDEGIC